MSQRWGLPLGILTVVFATAVGRAQPPGGEGVTVKVDRGDVVRTVTERGTLEAVRKADIVCRVHPPKPDQPASVIKWVIDDGTRVKKGDVILVLDDSALQDRLKAQEIASNQALLEKE